MRKTVLAAAAMAVLSVGPTFAQSAEEAQSSPEARALIERQLDAFGRDDADAAYAEAAPSIKAIFPDADTFMSMVRRGYAPVYRHRSVEFGPATRDGDRIQQEATFVDQAGQAWKALYRLSRQPDGTWLISACWLVKLDGSV
jgi:Domain of unknown function (DUF4864)